MTIPKASPQRPEDENLGVAANMAYGLQHVLTMYGGIVAVPLIVGQAAGLSPADIGLLIAASLFAGGLATLLQTLGLPFFGCQLPLVQGVSFAGVATMVAIVGSDGAGGVPAILGAVMAASLIGLLITPIFSRITKFFPPLVTGIVITTIGLTLMPVAFAIGISAVMFYIFGPVPTQIAIQKVATITQSFPLLAVPLFVFAGHLMNESGITERLIRLSTGKW